MSVREFAAGLSLIHDLRHVVNLANPQGDHPRCWVITLYILHNGTYPHIRSIIYQEWRIEACNQMMRDELGLMSLQQWPEHIGLRRARPLNMAPTCLALRDPWVKFWQGINRPDILTDGEGPGGRPFEKSPDFSSITTGVFSLP